MKSFLYLLILSISGIAANAAVIDCKPGKLTQLIGTETDATELTVRGQMDVTDFDFIADHMPQLRTLNLEAEIVAYKGAVTRNGSGVSESSTLPAYALFGTKITDLTIGGDITAFGEAALAGTSLENLTINAPVNAIPDYFITGVTTIETVELPATVVEIGRGAFSGCSNLMVVSAPGVTVINDDAFKGCTNLTEFDFNRNLTSLGDYAFASTGMVAVNLTQAHAIDEIGEGAFCECDNLQSVALPAGITGLPEAMLFRGSAIKELTLPSTLTTLGDYSLAGLTGFVPQDGDGVIAGTSLTTIGNYAMANWSSMSLLTFPETLSYLGDNAMQGWYALEKLMVPDGMTEVPALGSDVWKNTSQKDVTLLVNSSALASQFQVTPQWMDFSVTDMSSSIDLPGDDQAAFNLTVINQGDNLLLECTENITSVTLYDTMGRSLASLYPSDTTVTVSVNGISATLLVMVVNTESGKTHTKKIIR